jgi:vacuolar-type H+-ATPase subunit I/STV1
LDNDPNVVLESSNQDDFLYNLNEVNSIISKLESLENKKTDLKNQLKIFEDEFQSKKKYTDQKIKLMSKEAEMLDKTINIIKNLKNF